MSAVANGVATCQKETHISRCAGYPDYDLITEGLVR